MAEPREIDLLTKAMARLRIVVNRVADAQGIVGKDLHTINPSFAKFGTTIGTIAKGTLAFGAAIGGASLVVHAFSKTISEASSIVGKYSKFSMGGAHASMIMMVRDMQRNIYSSQRLSGSMVDFAKANERMKDSWTDVNVFIDKFLLKMGTAASNMFNNIANFISPKVDKLDKAMARFAKMTDKAFEDEVKGMDVIQAGIARFTRFIAKQLDWGAGNDLAGDAKNRKAALDAFFRGDIAALNRLGKHLHGFELALMGGWPLAAGGAARGMGGAAQGGARMGANRQRRNAINDVQVNAQQEKKRKEREDQEEKDAINRQIMINRAMKGDANNAPLQEQDRDELMDILANMDRIIRFFKQVEPERLNPLNPNAVDPGFLNDLAQTLRNINERINKLKQRLDPIKNEALINDLNKQIENGNKMIKNLDNVAKEIFKAHAERRRPQNKIEEADDIKRAIQRVKDTENRINEINKKEDELRKDGLTPGENIQLEILEDEKKKLEEDNRILKEELRKRNIGVAMNNNMIVPDMIDKIFGGVIPAFMGYGRRPVDLMIPWMS